MNKLFHQSTLLSWYKAKSSNFLWSLIAFSLFLLFQIPFTFFNVLFSYWGSATYLAHSRMSMIFYLPQHGLLEYRAPSTLTVQHIEFWKKIQSVAPWILASWLPSVRNPCTTTTQHSDALTCTTKPTNPHKYLYNCTVSPSVGNYNYNMRNIWEQFRHSELLEHENNKFLVKKANVKELCLDFTKFINFLYF